MLEICVCEIAQSWSCSFLNGKSGGWCFQGQGKWIFQNGEGSMVGSYEERIKVGWTTFVWELLEWQMEM